MAVLTGIDVLSIQAYVFGSNRLRDVLAASFMVEHVTQVEALCRLGGVTPERVLLAAGGNAIVQFDDLAQARQFASRYTRWLREEAPGLSVAVAHREYRPGAVAWALQALQVDLARSKAARRPSAEQLGLGVTAACAVTGLPAVGSDAQGQLVSAQVQCLRQRVREAQARWDRYLPAVETSAGAVTFPLELDRLGRTRDDTSLLGVVHVDGNGVGVAIQAWLEDCVDGGLPDADVLSQYKTWSQELVALGEQVLRKLVARVVTCVRREEGGARLAGVPAALGFELSVAQQPRTGAVMAELPLRPILLGGDDLTFVCDGRIALDLAAHALTAFEQGCLSHLGPGGEPQRLTACAGVALVRAHAPFHRSYALAEQLCRNAKRGRASVADRLPSAVEPGSWLDWHVGNCRPGETLEGLRQRQYDGQRLTLRPYPMAPLAALRRATWPWLAGEVLGPRPVTRKDGAGACPDAEPPGQSALARPQADEGGDSASTSRADDGSFRGDPRWSESRRRVKTLLGAGDEAEVRRALELWRVRDPELQLPGGMSQVDGGFIDGRSPLRDGIELLDLHLALDSELNADA